MSKRCPDCGFLNEDARIYCGSCGELLDPQLRLIKNLDEQTSDAKKNTYKTPPARREAIPPKNLFDEEYVPPKTAHPKKESSPLPWIILGLIVAAVVVALFVFG